MLPQPDSSSFRRALSTVALFLMLVLPAVAQTTSIGLSTVRAQLFEDENLFFYSPASDDHFAFALASGDFNGDGAEDLATGIPLHDNLGGFEPDSGIVVVRYGILGIGLAPGLADDVLSQTASGSPDPAEIDDQFGSALAACDFNGDAFDDLVVGIPGEDYAGFDLAGALQVHYGGPEGLPGAGDTFYTQSSPGIPGELDSFGRFGSTLTCGDFDADGFADLAIGAANEQSGGEIGAGAVIVVPGSALGLDATLATILSQDSPGMIGSSEREDSFGAALAVGDFNGDGFPDLGIGVPGENNLSERPTGEGAVQIVFGGTSGLTATGNIYRSDSSLGGISETGDQFGTSLAAGDFDGDGFADLAIGIPFEDLGNNLIVDTGQAAVIYGAAAGFDFGRTGYWFQDNIVGATTSEANDRFAFSLAAGDFDRDGFDDLASGSPGEFVLVPGDGVVVAWMGSATGLTAARNRGLARGYEGIPGPINQSARGFGDSLVCGDFDGDGHIDLAIGAPLANSSTLANVGDELVLYGALFADGFETSNSGLWTARVP